MASENDDRAARAEIALRAYAKHYGEKFEPETHLTDILVDLRHFADRKGIEFDKRNEMAFTHYSDESDEGEVDEDEEDGDEDGDEEEEEEEG